MKKKLFPTLLSVFLVIALCHMPMTSFAASSKTGWQYSSGNKIAYIDSDGDRVTGVNKIGNTVYAFDTDGKLMRSSKDRRVRIQSLYYDVRKDGTCRRGWNVYGGKLYYFGGSLNQMVRDKTVSKIYLQEDGTAADCLDVYLKTEVIKMIRLRSSLDASKSSQLRAMYNYLASGRRFHYHSRYPNQSVSNWCKREAKNMLLTNGGGCYGFACLFAACASNIGYSPTVVTGRIPGRRDQAADGYTRHCLVTIHGRYYDPEGQYAGWYRGCYGKASYGMHIKSRRSYAYNRQNGHARTTRDVDTQKFNESNVKKINATRLWKEGSKFYYEAEDGTQARPVNRIVVCKNRLYYFDPDYKNQAGTFLLKNKLYHFESKDNIGYYTTEKELKQLRKTAKTGKDFSALKEWIGEPQKFKDSQDSSCFSNLPGKDRTNYYPHIKVYTYVYEDETMGEVIEDMEVR